MMDELKDSKTQLMIFLDSIDQLAPDDGAFFNEVVAKRTSTVS